MTYKFGFIGAGNMGGALLTAAAKNNPDMKISVFDVFREKAEEYAEKYENVEATDLKKTVTESEYVFIGVKPQMAKDLFTDIAPLFSDFNPVLVSMLAGTSIEKLCTLSEKEMPVIRIMPNTPASIGEGVILYCSNELVTDEKLSFFINAMSGAGLLAFREDRVLTAKNCNKATWKNNPVYDVDSKALQITELPEGLGELSKSFTFGFENWVLSLKFVCMVLG